METKKKEAIRLAYGKYFKECEPDENGWSKARPQYKKDGNWYDAFSLDIEETNTGVVYRPRSISGIDNNLGWISIEIEEDLPKEDVDCLLYFPDGEIRCDRFLFKYKQFISTHLRHVTHYQPIQKPNPPIF